MTIYFAQAEGGGPVKIGFTDGDPQRRLTKLQHGHPWRLRLLRAIEGDRAVEAETHNRFAAQRLRGEWFSYSADMLSHGRPWSPPPKIGRNPLHTYLINGYGRLKALAARIGVTSGSISQWQAVPPHHVLAVEEFTGISRYELRPDIFGPAPTKKRRTA